jgi:putative DNA primase/helicase
VAKTVTVDINEGKIIEDKPEIEIIAGKLKDSREQILYYLSQEKFPTRQIYVQGGNEQWLSRILSTNGKVDCCEHLTVDKLIQELDDRFTFFGWKKAKEGFQKVIVDCPLRIGKNVHSASRWNALPKIKGILKLPVLKLDGTIVAKSGYDDDSEYLIDFDHNQFKFKTNPTKEDALSALALLKDLISESALADDKSRAGVIAMLLTAVSRNTFDYAPLFAISANSPGAGKGALTQVATIFATGNSSEGLTTFNPEEVEFKKTLLSTLQRGSSVVSFDNINRNHVFGGAEIEAALTSPTFSGRMLGGNEIASFSTKVLWLANGNKLRLSLDMGRRTILIHLDAKEENILEKEYKRDMVSLAIANRGEYVSAALTLLQAFLLERPVVGVKPLNGFTQWSNVVRNALIWLGEVDPVPTSSEIYSLDGIDEQRAILANLLHSWNAAHGTRHITAREIISMATGEYANQGLKSALTDCAIDRYGQMSTVKLGQFLRSNADIRVNNMRFIKAKVDRNDVVCWAIEIFSEDVRGLNSTPAVTPAVTPAPRTTDMTDFHPLAGDAGVENGLPTHERKNDQEKDQEKNIYRAIGTDLSPASPANSSNGYREPLLGAGVTAGDVRGLSLSPAEGDEEVEF